MFGTYAMKLGSLPSDEDMLRLKKELNFLPWTGDVPAVPDGFQNLVPTASVPEKAPINMQCVAHTVVTSAMFLRRGFGVTTRGGIAFGLDPSQDRNPQNDYLNEIAKHWRFSLDGHDLVDLSLFAESENPLVYCNRSVGGGWEVNFSDETERLASCLTARRRECFYVTAS